MTSKLFDSALFSESTQAFDFITNLLESSTEYSIIATGHDGKILLWNEGARHVYGYEPEDMIGKQTSDVLHTPEDRAAGLPGQIMQAALRDGKWEGTLQRVRKDGRRFVARVVKTPLRDGSGGSAGFLLISKDVSDEMHLAEELKATQFYTRSLIESNIDALMTTDPVGIVTDVNQQMEALTGRTREELIGSPFKQYFTEPERAEAGIKLVLREGKVTNYELTAVDKAGKETVVSYNATTFRDAEGRLQGVFASARDITEQKQLEVRLRDSQAYNRGLIESSVDGLITVDPAGLITDVNEQMCRMTGYEREELIGTAFADYFVDGGAATAGVRQTFDRGVVTDYVLTLATRSGGRLQVSFNASVFKDPSGEVRGIFASARDITEQATLQSQLAEERAYNRGLIESSVDGLVTVDPMLLVTDVNEQMCRMTGSARDELIGTRFPDHFTDAKRAAEGVRLTLDTGAVTNYELTLRAKDGRERLVSFNAAVFKDPSGEVRGIFASARDITEQASLTAQFAEERAYTRGLIEASVDGLVTVDQDLRITDVNEQMCRMAGRSRGQLVGSLFPEHFSEPDVAWKGVRLTFEQGAVTNYVLRLRSASGGELPVSFNAAVFRDTAGTVRGIFASARDITAQTSLESELQTSQSYTRSLIESNIDALMTTDPVGIVTDVNQQMEALTGRTREELVGSPFKQYFTEPARAEDGVRLVLREGKVTNYELTAVDKAGKETVVSYNAATFYDRDGKLQGVFAAARDVTEQKRLETQLREQQAYNRGLIESSVDGLVTVDRGGFVSDVNDRLCQMTGYARAELVGTPFADHFTEPDRARAGVQQTFDAGFVTEYALTLVSRTRRLLQVSFNASVFKDPSGEVRGIFASARDITDRVRLEDQLREQQTYLRGLIESSVDGLVTVDPMGFITDVNEQMCRMTGYEREELVGSTFKRYFTDPDQADIGVRRTFADGVVTNYALVLLTKDGHKRTVSFNASVYRGPDGRVAGIFASARDISEQDRLQRQLGEQQIYTRSLIEASADALFAVAPDGTVTDVNEEATRLTGRSRKHLVNSRFADLFTDPARAVAGVEQTLREGRTLGYELVLVGRGGRRIAVSSNAGVFADAAGTPIGILAGARDITGQKQLEQQLRDQQSYTRSLIESNIDALMTTDPVGIVTDVNQQMEALTGRTREELVGSPFKQYFTEPARAEDGVRLVLREGKVTNYELTAVDKAGKETVVSYNAATFYDRDGKLQGVFAAARDVTEQKRLEEQVRQQNRELTETTAFTNNVLESSTEYSIIAMDLSSRVLAWNEGARRNYGYAADEMVGKQSAETLHVPEDVVSGRVAELLATARGTGKAEGVFERVRKDGSRFTASVAITLRRDAEGKTIGYVVISKDITEQMRLQEELQRKNEELELQYQRVQEANRQKSEFLANMSHELRTPLNGAIGFTQLLYDGGAGAVSERQHKFLGNVLTSSKHLLQLINDILDLAKVEAGKVEFQPEPVDLAKLTNEVASVTREMAANKRLRLSIEIDKATGTPMADPMRLKQVLYNFLSNAIKFTPDGGAITVRIRPEDADSFRIEVQDSGIGIKPEDMARLFVEFQQLDASAAKRYAGTGLGLALTKRIVEAQGGHVGVNSVPGQGSTFFAVLPRRLSAATTEAQVTAAGAAEAPTSGAGPRILVVEDHPEERRAFLEALSSAGYRPEGVGRVEEAIQRLGVERYAAVVLDLLLPDALGLDVVERIRREGPNRDTPVIVATIAPDLAEMVAVPIQGVLTKPVSAEELRAALVGVGVTPGQGQRVLVVDDDPEALTLAEATLRQAGYAPICAGDGPSGLSAVDADDPAAVVLDLLMPGMDGLEFLSRLRPTDRGRHLPVLVWTGKDLSGPEVEELRARTQALVRKGQPGMGPVLHALAQVLAEGDRGAAPAEGRSGPATPSKGAARRARHGRGGGA